MNDGAPDVIILEADGLIDDRHGYAYYIVKRLLEYDYQPLIVKLAETPEKLASLPHLPIIISGGMTEVTSEIHWVTMTRDFVAQVIESNRTTPLKRRPLLGICFGAQIIAEAFSPGSVSYLTPPDVSVTTIFSDDPKISLFTGLSQSFKSYTFHYNQINSDDLQVLAQSRDGKNAFIEAFEIPGAAVYGVQFHPEFSYGGYLRLLNQYANLLTSMGQDMDELQQTLPAIENKGVILHNFLEEAANASSESKR